MKKSILSLVVTVFIAGTIFTACHSSGKKVEDAQDKLNNAQDKVTEAKQELNKAREDSIQQFRNDAQEKFLAHEKSITEFKARIANEKRGKQGQIRKRPCQSGKKEQRPEKKIG